MRTRNPIIVLGPDGRPLAGAQVYTRVRATNADAPVYTTEAGGAAAANPAITDAHGRVLQWAERGAYASTISGPGVDPYVEEWDSSPGSDKAIDGAWVADGAIGERAIADAAGIAYKDLAADVLSALVPIGAMIPYAGGAEPAGGRFLIPDGRLLPSANYATLDGLIGGGAPAGTRHIYNTPSGTDPGGGQFRIPDKRGRGSIGADDLGTARGPAGILPHVAAASRVRGVRIGEDAHLLTARESGLRGHGHGLGGVAPGGAPTRPDDVLFGSGGNGFANAQASGPALITRGALNVQDVGDAGALDYHNIIQPVEVDSWLIRVL